METREVCLCRTVYSGDDVRINNLHCPIEEHRKPCSCNPEAGIACEVALSLMDQIHDAVRQMATRDAAEAWVAAKERLRVHYLEREA